MIWGTSFILTKRGLESYTNYQLAAFRMLICSIVLLPFLFRAVKLINKKNIGPILIMNIIGNGIPALLFATAQTKVESSLAGILNSLTPLFTMIVGMFWYKIKTHWIAVLGIFIAFAGAVGLFSENLSTFFSGQNWYGLLIALATFFYGINSNNVKQNLKDIDSISITALTYFIIGPACGIYLLFSDFSYALTTPHYVQNFLCIAALAVFGSALASLGWNILLKRTTAVAASSVTYIIPLFAIVWGMLDGERISVVQLSSMGVILFGVYLVNKGKENGNQ